MKVIKILDSFCVPFPKTIHAHLEVMKPHKTHTHPGHPQDNKTLKHSRGGGSGEVGGRRGWRDVKLVTWKAEHFQKRSGQPVVGFEFFPSPALFRNRGENCKHRPLHSE